MWMGAAKISLRRTRLGGAQTRAQGKAGPPRNQLDAWNARGGGKLLVKSWEKATLVFCTLCPPPFQVDLGFLKDILSKLTFVRNNNGRCTAGTPMRKEAVTVCDADVIRSRLKS